MSEKSTSRGRLQLQPWQIIALEQMNDDLASTKIERRTDMNARSAGVDTGAEREKGPEVREQLDGIEATIGRLSEVISRLTTRFRPVLAEIGGEPPVTKEATCHNTLAPLAEEIATLEERVTGEIQRLKALEHRCEV